MTLLLSNHSSSLSANQLFRHVGDLVQSAFASMLFSLQAFPPANLKTCAKQASPYRKHLLALVHSAVEQGEVLGVDFAGDEVGEVADLHQNLTKRADDKAGNASRVVGVHLCLDGPSCVRVRAESCVELIASFVVVFVYLTRAVLDGCTEGRGWRL